MNGTSAEQPLRDKTSVDMPPFSKGRSPAGRSRTALVALILIAAVLLGTAFRVDSMRHKHGLHIDEVISYITAAGRLGDFSHPGATTLDGAWVPAAQWKSGLGPGRTFDFGQIISGLAKHDVHPPLYFCLLHIWTLVVGVKFWTGPSLNLIIDVLCGAALFGLARRLLRDPVAAALVVLIWSVSPAVRMTSSM
ncbi:MAG: glycosyltransferase family 39 protein, partial [Thermoleophilia bacterium]